MPGSPDPGSRGICLLIRRGWLFLTMTGFRAALAMMDLKVASTVSPFIGER
jgi:hypothetical protein